VTPAGFFVPGFAHRLRFRAMAGKPSALEHVPEKCERFSEKNMLKIKDVLHTPDSI
jgi:hypothetical protein